MSDEYVVSTDPLRIVRLSPEDAKRFPDAKPREKVVVKLPGSKTTTASKATGDTKS